MGRKSGTDATTREPAVIDGATGLPDPSPPALRRAKHIRLRTVADCHREAAKVYRDMRARIIESQDGSRLIWALSQISRMIAAGELEARLMTLEELVDDEAI